jgi:hypothetical protein
MDLTETRSGDAAPSRDDQLHDSEARIHALEREVRLGRLFGEVAAALTSKGSFEETLGRAADVFRFKVPKNPPAKAPRKLSV